MVTTLLFITMCSWLVQDSSRFFSGCTILLTNYQLLEDFLSVSTVGGLSDTSGFTALPANAHF